MKGSRSQLSCNKFKCQRHQERCEKHVPSSVLFLPLERALLKQMSPESEKKVKKLVSVLAISTLITETREKAIETIETAKTAKTAKAIETAGADKNGEKSEGEYLENLAQIPYIKYPITFWMKSVPILALLDSGSEVNAIYPTFAKEPGLFIRLTNVRAQKIDGSMLDIFEMVVIAFSVTDKAN